jgi:hypothetical protein
VKRVNVGLELVAEPSLLFLVSAGQRVVAMCMRCRGGRLAACCVTLAVASVYGST